MIKANFQVFYMNNFIHTKISQICQCTSVKTMSEYLMFNKSMPFKFHNWDHCVNMSQISIFQITLLSKTFETGDSNQIL